MEKIIIDGAEFIITGQKLVQTGFYMKKYAFIDEPRDETVIFSEYAFIDEPVQTGFINTENIPPPPYDGEIITENYPPPAYISHEGIEDPPKYQRNGWKIRRCKLLKFRTQHCLPSYDEIYYLSHYAEYKKNNYYQPCINYGKQNSINALRNMELLPVLRYNSTDRKIQKLSLKSTNLINYTSSDNYNLGATLAQYNLTTNYLEPIINLQSPLTQTHSRHCYHQTSWSHLEDLISKYLSANCYSSPSIASPINLSSNNNN